jgi:hypothetical protein
VKVKPQPFAASVAPAAQSYTVPFACLLDEFTPSANQPDLVAKSIAGMIAACAEPANIATDRALTDKRVLNFILLPPCIFDSPTSYCQAKTITDRDKATGVPTLFIIKIQQLTQRLI